MDWKINDITFAVSGLTNVSRERFNMATDRMTFEAAGRGIDEALLFTFDQIVEVKRDGKPFFYGKAGRTPINGVPNSEGHAYEILGPWDQLERLTFMQRWKSGSWVGDSWVSEMRYKSRCVLGQSESGDAISLGEVISSVISYAMVCGVKISIGTIDNGPNIPWEEVVDLSCAEVIRRMARWVPGSVGYFDYSSTVPAFNFVSISSSKAVTLSVSDLSSVSLTQIGSRSVPAVVLIYERTDSFDGQSLSSQTIDAYPPESTGREIGAVVQTIGLSGLSGTVQRQKIYSEAVPAMTPGAIQSWFLAKHPEWEAPGMPGVFNPKFTEVEITAVSRKYGWLGWELIEGSLQDWMRASIKGVPNPDAVYAKEDQEDVITVTLDYVDNDDEGKPLRSVKGEIITTTITATDCHSGIYERTTIDQGAEEIPVGLAQYLYTVLNATHYQGSLSHVSEEVTGSIGLGNRILITGGNSAWLTMSAIVQSISERLDSGETQIKVGPPSHLTTSDILELRRANRVRKPSIGSGSRISGLSSQASILLSSASPKGHGAGSPGSWGVHLEKIITDVRFDSSSNCIQVKTREVSVQHAEDESDWTTIEGGVAEACS